MADKTTTEQKVKTAAELIAHLEAGGLIATGAPEHPQFLRFEIYGVNRVKHLGCYGWGSALGPEKEIGQEITDKVLRKVLRAGKRPLRRCQSLHGCFCCGGDIKLGELYRDGGYGSRIHEDCYMCASLWPTVGETSQGEVKES